MGCGGTPTADCFADEEDAPDEEFNAIWNGDIPIDWEIVLSNLDMDESGLDEIKNLGNDKTYIHIEYWGMSKVEFEFSHAEDGIHVQFEGQEFLCEF